MPAPQKLLQALDDFRSLGDRELQSELLIEYAERFEQVPETVAQRPFANEHRVPACESEAYVWAKRSGEGVQFYFAVENPQGISAKALAVILNETISGAGVEEILSISEDLVYDLFGRNISMGKGQGLMGMVRMVKALAKTV